MLKAVLDYLYWTMPGIYGSRLAQAAITGRLDKVPKGILDKYLTSRCFAATTRNPKTLEYDAGLFDFTAPEKRKPKGLRSLSATTPLHLAVMFQNVNQLQLTRSDYECQDGDGDTIVHIATRFGRLSSIKELLIAPDLATPNNRGVLPLVPLLKDTTGKLDALEDILTIDMIVTPFISRLVRHVSLLSVIKGCGKLDRLLGWEFPDHYKAHFPEDWWNRSKQLIASKKALQNPNSDIAEIDIF